MMTELFNFVPISRPPQSEQLEALAKFVASAAGRLLVLTGAGASTESGLPDYRSEGVGLYARTKHRPVQYADFIRSAHTRSRYWARNYAAWPRFSAFRPNPVHNILAEWERKGRLASIVTQNVDALHSLAGSQSLVELHGCAHRVACLTCPRVVSRHQLQQEILALNLDWGEPGSADQLAPDGDVILTDSQIDSFVMPYCSSCGGVLKPDIVFFGDNVPVARRDRVFALADQADALLCVGTSLQVYSGYRVAVRVKERARPIALINIGSTRADHLAMLKIEGRAGQTLTEVDRLLNSL